MNLFAHLDRILLLRTILAAALISPVVRGFSLRSFLDSVDKASKDSIEKAELRRK